jgi:hypothetical protein
MLNKGIILLSVLIDLLIQVLTILEWIDPFKNVLILFLINLAFTSRWTWQVILPSLLVYHFPNLKFYIERLIMEMEEKGKLELLLRANSLSQHALLLKDRLFWLYKEEINFCLHAFKGNLSFQARLIIIGGIILISGLFNLSPSIFELVSIHLLLKHSKLGIFYRDLYGSTLKFIDFSWYYKYFYEQTFKPPFKLNVDEFTIEIIESIDKEANIQFTDVSGTVQLSLDQIKSLKPIVKYMKEDISTWQEDQIKMKRSWTWSRIIKYDYNQEEWNLVKNIYKHQQGLL